MSSEAYRFPLEKILEWRESLERERAVSLARALEGERGARTVVEGLQRLRDERNSRVARARASGRNSVGHLQNLELIIDQLETRLAEANTQYDEARHELEVSLEEFRGAHRDRKTLDHLRERRQGEWATEQGREDQRRSDEISRNRRGLGEMVDGGDRP